MKQTFQSITAGNINIVMNELEVGEILSLAKLNPRLKEHQLSGFLRHALDDDTAPYTMTCQQRYFCLLHYLSAQKENDLAVDVNINDYLHLDAKPWKEQVTVGDISVRQLNGCEIEALEVIAEDIGDWMLGAMALQISYGDQLPYIQPLTDQVLASKIIKSRFLAIQKLSQDELNQLYEKYAEAQDELNVLLTIGFDSEGVTLYEAKGGLDSEPARFQIDSTFTGFTKRLFSTLVEGSKQTSAELGDEFSGGF